MTAIWLLSSRGRPAQAQETIDACQEAGMTSRGVLYVDETVDDYRGIRLPGNWSIHCEREWGSLQASLSWCYREYPDATRYGWLADDVRPRTHGWDTKLERAAGDWGLSYARDLWFSEEPSALADLQAGGNLSSGLCWGGELVRSVGWWALPGVRQAWIDVAWTKIVGPLGLHRYVEDVTVEHLNYRTGKRERDAVDDWTRGGDDYIDRDIVRGQEWYASGAYAELLMRVAVACGRTFDRDGLRRIARELRDSRAQQLWGGGRSGARLINFLRSYDEEAECERLAQILHPDTDARSAGLDRPVHSVGARADVL